MNDFETDYKEAVEAGRRNLRATKLLSNWCFHAEFVRSPGRGLIEAETGLPIGHMGVQCKFSKKNSMHCWLLEDAAYDFYQNNCKGCTERVPIGIPNIMYFVDPREKAAEKRKAECEEEERERKQKQIDRRQARMNLRCELSLEETFVFDLLDEIDNEDTERNDPRLEQLANLAPETFTRKVIEHLLPAVLHEHLPYSKHAAKALLRAPLEPEEKLSVAVCMAKYHEPSSTAIEIILSDAKKLSLDDLRMVLIRFVSLALGPPPEMHFLPGMREQLNDVPIRLLFESRHSDICAEVDELINDGNSTKLRAAVEIILATDSAELLSIHTKSIFAKLMRRRILLPQERRESGLLFYLRKAASECFKRFPTETDKIIQSFLADNDDTGSEEAYATYASALEHKYQEKIQIGTTQRTAFRRLLWAAVESPNNSMDNAVGFFRHSWDELAQLAVEHFDDLIGAAATLSEKYAQVDIERSLELTDNVLDQLERNRRRSAIDSLQGALIEWAAIGAKHKGLEGIEQFLELYRRLPDDQAKMRGNMIAHVSKLLTGVESLKIVLSDWYRALMDESTLVRAGAVKAWEGVPYDLVKNFPDLFFEAFSVLLTDTYIIVHRSAVHSLRYRSFPNEERHHIKRGLWSLIVYYSQKTEKEDFLVDCIDAFASLCLSSEERKGKLGELLAGILLSLEGIPLYHAVDKLHLCFQDVPGFAKVALKSIQDDDTRSISTDDCVSTILRSPRNELQNCVDDIKKAFEALRPFRPENFVEALLYAAALTKAGNYASASDCFGELAVDRYPKERWRRNAAVVALASQIEHVIGSGEAFTDLIERWNTLLSGLEKENEE